MPISSRKLIYDVRRKTGAFNTGSGNSYTVLDLVSTINEAYEIIVENSIKMADEDADIKNAIRKLEILNHPLELQLQENTEGKVYLAKYPSNLYKRLNQQVLATCVKDCGDLTKTIIPRIVQSDDIQEARKSPYRQANFPWEQLIAYEGADGLYIYSDKKLELKSVLIDYYRKINYIEAPSLVECAGYEYTNYDDKLIVNDVDFDLDNTYIARKVVDVAVLLNRTDTSSPQEFQLKLNQILATKQLT